MQTSTTFKTMVPPSCNAPQTPFPSFNVRNAPKNWIKHPRINTQQLFVDPMQIGTFQNDNDTRGNPIYGNTKDLYNNVDAYPKEFDRIIDIERIHNSAYQPYFDKYVDPNTANQQYDWSREYVANVKTKAHTGLIPSVNYLKKNNIVRYN